LAAPDAAALAGRVRAFAAAMAGQTGARTAEDVLHRRLRIGQLDSARCAALMPAAEAGLADALGRPAA
ncbi:MAG: hypothetical protein HUK26_05460, partial [Duodenibacillus sp.]|nr:hypothetical protein [Duodenibacillus sp.]